MRFAESCLGESSVSLEVKAYFTGVSLMLGWYVFSAFLATQERFGFNQLKALTPPNVTGLLICAGLVVVLVHLRDSGERLSTGSLPLRKLLLPAVLCALAAAPVFWVLRTGFINSDGLFNMVSLQSGLKIMHHDEMLSTIMITKIWESGIAGVRPEDSIALFSVFWGAVYVFVTVLTGGRLVGRRWPLFLCLSLSCGFIQMFAGDVEFYSMVAALLSLFFLSALEHTRGKISVVFPGIVLLLAIFSHLLAGWIIPAYLYLLYRCIRENKVGDVWLTLGAIAVIAALLFILVSSAGLPIHWLTRSHAMGSADKSTFDMLATPSLHYHAAVLNVLFLVFPFWGFFVLLNVFRRYERNSFNAVMTVSTGMLLILAMVWNLGLGPYFDWNLIASVGIPASVLLWGTILKGSWQKGMKAVVTAALLTGALHSWTWIVGNHFTFSMIPIHQLEEIPFPTGESNWVIPCEQQADVVSGSTLEEEISPATHIVD